MPDRVSGLLAKLDAREHEHREMVKALDTVLDWGGEVGAAEYIRATVAEGLRLCRAHRDLIATLKAGMPDDLVMDGFEHEGWEQATKVVIESLARGLGVEETEDR